MILTHFPCVTCGCDIGEQSVWPHVVALEPWPVYACCVEHCPLCQEFNQEQLA